MQSSVHPSAKIDRGAKPALKVRRKVDDTARIRARNRDGACLYGLFRKDGRCVEGIDPHHIKTVGAGGDDSLENLICLCRYHHDLAQSHVIKPQELREILNHYYHYDEMSKTSTLHDAASESLVEDATIQ